MRCMLSDKCTKCHSTLYTLYSNLTAAIGEDINASDWSRPSKPTELSKKGHKQKSVLQQNTK